jgi:hypothetical protein
VTSEILPTAFKAHPGSAKEADPNGWLFGSCMNCGGDAALLPNGQIACATSCTAAEAAAAQVEWYYRDWLPSQNGGPAEAEEAPVQLPPQLPWPKPLDALALHGLAGRVVQRIEPHTEADQAALLFSFLTMFGNAAGRDAYVLAEAHQHTAALFATLVGQSSRARKGSATRHIKRLMRMAAEDWTRDCIGAGLVSGEGLVWSVRDAITVRRKLRKGEEPDADDGRVEEITDPGVIDKRRLFVAAEFAAMLKVGSREGNTLTETVREAWDGDDLQTSSKNAPAKATRPHISALAHITQADLDRYLTETDTVNGFANRFLLVCAKRSKLLPDGGALAEASLSDLAAEISQALGPAKRVGCITRDREAAELWNETYPYLTANRPGLLGAATARAEPQTLRLSLIYALLDQADAIYVEHVQAALAAWRYCERSGIPVR